MLQTGSPLGYLRVLELVTLMASYYPHLLRVDDVLRLTGTAGFADQWTTKLSGGQDQRSASPAPSDGVGARGFVVKDAPLEQLADAIRRVAAGERVVDPALAAETLASGVSR